MDKLTFAMLFSAVVTSIAFLEHRYNETIDRSQGSRLAVAHAQNRIRRTAEARQALRVLQVQRVVQHGMSYAISGVVLCFGLYLSKAGMLPF